LGLCAAGFQQRAPGCYDTRRRAVGKVHGKVTFDDMAYDLAARWMRPASGQVALAGTAVGGAIAIHFAVRHAARTGALR
jgi:3-oxoadipate enol-lactonase